MCSLVKTTLPNGKIESQNYDALNRLLKLESKKDATVLSGFTNSLNASGMRTSVTEQDSRKVDYKYDNLYRLTEEKITDAVNGNRTVGYLLDTVGNRLSKTDSVGGTTSYVYDNNDRLLSETTIGQATTYTYDNKGNTTSKTKGTEITLYTWNDEGRLVAVQTPTETATYQYNEDGIRVSQTIGGVKTNFLIDSNRNYAQVLEEYNPTNGSVIVSYVYGHDLISQNRNGNKSFYLYDGLGSVKALTNSSGVITDRYFYDGYGNTIGATGSTVNKYLFTGEQFDSSLDQYYLRDRFYNQSVGRFTRSDVYEGEIEEPFSLHKYIYANNSPTNFYDPSGLFSLQEYAAIGSIIGSLSGASIGGYLGYVNNGNKIGWPVFFYSALGAVTGLVAGAQLGSLLGYFAGAASSSASGGALGTITKMTPKVVQQIGRIISNPSAPIFNLNNQLKYKSAISFAAGVISGGVAGTFTPNEFTHPIGVSSLLAYGGGNVANIGYRWFQQTIFTTVPSTPGALQLASVFVTGFNLGFFATIQIRQQLSN